MGLLTQKGNKMSKLETALSALKAIVNGMPDEVIDNASDTSTARWIQSLLDRCNEAIQEIEGDQNRKATK